MIRIVRTLLVMTCLTLCTSCWSDDLKYSFVILVRDEQGKPVSDAEVEFTFLADSIPMQDCVTRASTDQQGRAKFKGVAYDLGFMNISKDGYYPTREKMYVYLSSPYVNGKHTDYEPKDAIIEMVLKPEGTPVPMYVKAEDIVIPGLADGKIISYDLEAGDWVEPNGKGKCADFIWAPTITKDIEGKFHWNLDLTFSQKGDGIVAVHSPIGYDAAQDRGSALRSPTTAPENGYLETMKWTSAEDPSGRKVSDHIYIFRVRTIQDAAGKISGGFYGKIYFGPFLNSNYKYIGRDLVNKGDYLRFTYYLNPDGSRNLEFDVNDNLFKNLPRGQGHVGP